MLSFQSLVILSVLLVSFGECSYSGSTSYSMPPTEPEEDNLVGSASWKIEKIIEFLDACDNVAIFNANLRNHVLLRDLSSFYKDAFIYAFKERFGDDVLNCEPENKEKFGKQVFNVISGKCKEIIIDFRNKVKDMVCKKQLTWISEEGDSLDFIVFYESDQLLLEFESMRISNPEFDERDRIQHALEQYSKLTSTKIHFIIRFMKAVPPTEIPECKPALKKDTLDRLRDISNNHKVKCIQAFEKKFVVKTLDYYFSDETDLGKSAFEAISGACGDIIWKIRFKVQGNVYRNQFNSISGDGYSIDFLAFYEKHSWWGKYQLLKVPKNRKPIDETDGKIRICLSDYSVYLEWKIGKIMEFLNNYAQVHKPDSGAKLNPQTINQLKAVGEEVQTDCIRRFEHGLFLKNMDYISDDPTTLGQLADNAVYEVCKCEIEVFKDWVTKTDYKEQLQPILEEGNALDYIACYKEPIKEATLNAKRIKLKKEYGVEGFDETYLKYSIALDRYKKMHSKKKVKRSSSSNQ